jgi:hypothetical protein
MSYIEFYHDPVTVQTSAAELAASVEHVRLPGMLWLAECPVLGDQGLVGAVLTEDQKVVFMCDSCATVWCAPEEIGSGTCTQPTGPDWETHCGTHVRSGTTKWADREHVDRTGWKNLDWREI